MAINNADALDQIVAIMSGTQWNADTLDAIAEVLAEAGYVLNNYEEPDDYPGPKLGVGV